jgi:surface polysaccharide O-acyltransferase-like enzyme
MDLERNQKIVQQVERWDLYARLTPTLFLVIAGLLLLLDIVSQQTILYVGLTGFAFTAVVWWWWAIFTIKYLVMVLNSASKGISEVAQEVKSVTDEIRDLRK